MGETALVGVRDDDEAPARSRLRVLLEDIRAALPTEVAITRVLGRLGFDVRIEWPTIFGASLGDIILPLGISFYVFHTLSYVIDVYRRFIPAQRDFILYTDYVLFFPQLVAGPILRAADQPVIVKGGKAAERRLFRAGLLNGRAAAW